MHRQALIDALLNYRTLHPDETATADQFLDFVRNHPDCFERTLGIGHITGSAWIVDESGENILLTHHRKLDRWLQLGGHADGDSDVLAVAFKEACEESGLTTFEAALPDILDIDIHPIPARHHEPEHLHYDVRYALRATGGTDFVVSDESYDLAWVALDDLCTFTQEASMIRMRDKWVAHLAKA